MSILGNFVWSIADQLRGVYRPHQYGGIILPFTILRRLDCLLEPTRDDVRALSEKFDGGALDVQVKRKTGLTFYNTSQYDFARLLEDPEGLRANLIDYISHFSGNIDVFERFGFEAEINRLEEKNRLYLIVARFAEVDLHPDTVPNAAMGDLYEHLIYKFAEASNEEAGEHYTPRDAIRLMVDLLFAEENEALLEPGTIRTIYDPTAGTGGMLSVAEERLLERNKQARLRLYGQEINDLSYAICKSDMIGKGQDVGTIRLGDTLADDKFSDKTFDFCMSNPPYGVDWKASKDAVEKEHREGGPDGRFSPGLPPISDGQMLFLTHLAHKMRPAHEGGGRAGIVLNSSPLFSGAAESGSSEIRRWLLENDLLDTIVALPTDMFFNTGISTYIWILNNSKQAERRGKVQLIDASSMGSKMDKSLGSKRKEINPATREQVVKLYDAFTETENSKILKNSDFGYWTITVERPLRHNFSAHRASDLDDKALAKAFAKGTDPTPFLDVLARMGERIYLSRDEFIAAVRQEFDATDLRMSAAQYRNLATALGEPDEAGAIVTDAKGSPVPDPKKSVTENVPFTYGDNSLGDAGRPETLMAYFEAEVAPYLPDAWIDSKKTKVGYEIPFTRYFYTYNLPRPLAGIDHDLEAQVANIMDLLQDVQARRTALVERTLTGGLDESVEMKDSTLSWTSKVPSHWRVANIRRFAQMKTGHTPSRSNPEYWENCTIPWITLADVWQLRSGKQIYVEETEGRISETGLANSSAELLPTGTVILSRTASVGFAGIMAQPMATSQDYWNWICGPELMPEYLVWVFRAMRQEFNALMIGSTHKTIYQPVAAAIRIPVPPLSEQREIVAHIEKHIAQIDSLNRESEELIRLSQDRRIALIAAAVTGQIDMRGGTA
ncbi:N-6 DNA methylase [Streptomyces bottropensis]|uniref:N-6 DNA methylase n=1 Tax=Streptomyces bottropensis TaxID=42235 RepID=UPI0036A49F59